jgi:preprotein translocase subunit YajC
MLYALLQILAEGEAPSGNLASLIFPLLAMCLLFYFLLIRPQKRQQQERMALITSLKKNDKVLTSAGIIGTVVHIHDKEDQVALRIDDSANVRLRVLKSSIVRILTGDEAKDQAGKSAQSSEAIKA